MKELKEAVGRIKADSSSRVFSLEIEREWMPKLMANIGKWGDDIDKRMDFILGELRELVFDLR